MYQRHGTAVSCRHAEATMLHRPHTFFAATPVGSAADKARELRLGDRSFNVVGPRLWNALPIAFKHIETVPLFVKTLKTHIFKEELC